MKTKAIRFLTLMIAVLMFATFAVSCANDTPDDPPATNPDNTEENPDAGKTDDPIEEQPSEPTDAAGVLATFPQKDLGDEFLIAASSYKTSALFIEQFPINEEYSSEIVHNALLQRDWMIEEYFDIDIAYADIGAAAMFDQVSNTVRSGDDVYAMALGTLYQMGIPMLNNSLLHDLNDVENINLSKPWWNKNSVDAFTINDTIYMATGAITNRFVYSPYAVLFNTRLLEDVDLTSPYALIESGDWTFEEFQYMIMDTSYEINGDDRRGVEDFYGLAPADDSQTAWFFACGGKWFESTEDGELLAVYEEERNYNLLSEVLAFHKTDDILPYKNLYDSNAAFKEGRAIFHATALCDINMLADMEDPYGIVPLPKYDASQEEYYSNTNKYFNTMALIPSSVNDTESVGLLVEVLAAVSQYTSLDKQYDTVLLNRKALDAESKANLQLVVESSMYDWGYMVDPAGFGTTVRLAMCGQKNITEFGSTFASLRDAIKTEMDAIAEKHQ